MSTAQCKAFARGCSLFNALIQSDDNNIWQTLRNLEPFTHGSPCAELKTQLFDIDFACFSMISTSIHNNQISQFLKTPTLIYSRVLSLDHKTEGPEV